MTKSARPDIIPSATAPEDGPSSFSVTEYQALRQRYLEKRVRTGRDAALPDGIRLRRKIVQPAILNDTPGYKALKKQIHGLERRKDHQEIFRLLYTLSEWQKSVNRPFPFVGDESDDDQEKPVELIDLTDDQEVIDVDAYILGVLLVKVVKAESMDDERSSDTEDAPTPVIKQEQGDNLPKEAHKDKSSQQEVLDMSSSPKEPAKKKQRQQNKKKSPSKEKKKDTILFEFKFCSMNTDDDSESNFEDYEFAGVLNIPLLRDAKSGMLCIPPGDSIVKGFLTRKIDKQASNGSDSETTKENFTARIVERTRDGQNMHHLYLGYTYQNGTLKKISPEGEDNATLTSLEYNTFDLDLYSLEDWARNAGGELVLDCRLQDTQSSDSKTSDDGTSDSTSEYSQLRLYTVLSENIPGQAISKLAPGASPDWDRLEELVVMNGIGTLNDPTSAVAEYKRFIALKLSHDDWDSKQFAPSPQVDKIWHIHLAFTEHYQHDIMAFSVQICGKAHLVQHCPFLSEDSLVRYQATFDGVVSEDLTKIIGSPADMRFWPKPDTVYQPPSSIQLPSSKFTMKRAKAAGFGCC